MNVLYVGLARSLWLFDVPLMNPMGISLQGVFDMLREKYKFGQSPKHQLDFDAQQGLAFKSGTFTNAKDVPILVGLTIYKDGFVADSLSSTDDSTDFLQELAGLIEKNFGLSIPRVKKGYVSQVVFESDVSLTQISPLFLHFLKLLDKRYKPVDEKPRHFETAGVSFWTEDVSQPLAPAAFKVERKIGAPFSDNQYFSQAPLETHLHIELLNSIEQSVQTTKERNA